MVPLVAKDHGVVVLSPTYPTNGLLELNPTPHAANWASLTKICALPHGLVAGKSVMPAAVASFRTCAYVSYTPPGAPDEMSLPVIAIPSVSPQPTSIVTLIGFWMIASNCVAAYWIAVLKPAGALLTLGSHVR